MEGEEGGKERRKGWGRRSREKEKAEKGEVREGEGRRVEGGEKE